MLAIHFSGRTTSKRCTSGATGAIYAVSSSLRTECESDDLAIYQGGIWHSVSSADSYDSIAVDQPCRVRFQQLCGEGASLNVGPFPSVTIARGVIKTSGVRPRILAIFDDSLEMWRAFDEGSTWPVVAIEEALDTSTSAA